MKRFKRIDCTGSILLIIFFACYSRSAETVFTAYFVTGGWQSVSMIVHAKKKCFTHKWGRRYIYHWIAFISIITLPVGSYWILLFTAPIMALYYCYLCYRETFVTMNERPLSLLK